ncbi:MAG: acyltransferase [Muribaculaceae bacterium]|nr:acyltransferase [Muribaculaceae bacterium]
MNNLTSKTIELLRFPLITGVVFVHNYTFVCDVSGGKLIADTFPITYYVSTLFSEILGRVSVPLFFFISGYLFFYKVDKFNISIYWLKLRRRFRTLLIPYLFWNLLFLVIYLSVSSIPYFSVFFAGKYINLTGALFGSLDSRGILTYPAAIQFWFIRDLIVCVIISPLLFQIIMKTRNFGVILLGISWLLGIEIPYIGIRGFSMTGLFFFSFGAWLSCNRKDITNICDYLKFIAFFYPGIVITDLLTKSLSVNPYIHRIGILSGLILCLLFTAWIIKKTDIRPAATLTSATFFIYAIHEPWLLSQLRKVTYIIVNPQSDLCITLCYFGLVALVIIISIYLYHIMKHIMPSFTDFITGCR